MPTGGSVSMGKGSASVYEHFHSPYSDHNRFLNNATQAEKHFLRDFERYHQYTTKKGKGGKQAGGCANCPRCSELGSSNGRPLPTEVDVYPDLYVIQPETLGYPLVTTDSPVHADIATGLPLETKGVTEKWRECRVCMYKIPVKNNIIKGFMRPPHQDYSHYKYHGFAGQGAKTSWAHNPKFKMLGVSHVDLMDPLRDHDPPPLQKIVGGICRSLTPVEKKLVKEFRQRHSYHRSHSRLSKYSASTDNLPKPTPHDGKENPQHMQGILHKVVDLETKEEVQQNPKEQIEGWKTAHVVTYRQPMPDPEAYRDKGAPSHGAPAPFHHRYKHYKYNGFAGEGAKTSWARNPKMSKLYD